MKSASYQTILTWLGLAPFGIFCLGYYLIPEHSSLKYQFLHYFITYGAIILTFLSGIHWGLQLKKQIILKKNLYILSNIVALLAFSILIIPLASIQLIFLFVGFLFVLIIDLRIYQKDYYTKPYITLRTLITVPVLILILLCLLNTAFNFHILTG